MKKLLLVLLVSVLAFSCGKDDTAPKEDKAEVQAKKIREIIPDRYLNDLRDHGMEIHPGTTPPNVEGEYWMSPVLVQASNIDGYSPVGSRFVNESIQFYNQNHDDFSIDFNGLFARNIEGVITGSGNAFTVYGKREVSASGGSIIMAYLYSGTMEQGNIKNLQRGEICIDDSNWVDRIPFREGDLVIFHDGDGESEWVPSF